MKMLGPTRVSEVKKTWRRSAEEYRKMKMVGPTRVSEVKTTWRRSAEEYTKKMG